MQEKALNSIDVIVGGLPCQALVERKDDYL
jgi:site-specific DNA-cytosine methylase